VIVIKICFYTVDFAFVFIVYATVALFISCTQLKAIIQCIASRNILNWPKASSHIQCMWMLVYSVKL